MAVQIKRSLIDDLAALENPQGPEVPAERTTVFALDGEEWEIDLSPENQERLAEALDPFRRAGRRVKGKSRPRPKSQRDESARIREWARTRDDVEVNGRGRIPAAVVAKYKKETASV